MSETQRSPVPEEWLSAYLDGELSADEAASVEAAVASDGDVAARLESFRELRDVLRSLPKPRLNGSLLEGRSLDEPVDVAEDAIGNGRVVSAAFGAAAAVDAAAIGNTPVDVSRPGGRARRGRVVMRWAGAAAALGLMGVLAIVLLPPVGQEAAMVADRAAAPARESKFAPESGAAPSPASAGLTTRTMDREAFSADEGVEAVEAGTQLADGLNMAAGPMINPTLITPPAFNILPATADIPRPGELVEILENDAAGEVTVVEWVVADVDTSLGELRLFLQRLGVPEAAIDEQSLAQNGDLRAVYVQADAPVMDAVIAQTNGVGLNRLSMGSEPTAKAGRAMNSNGGESANDPSPVAGAGVGGPTELQAETLDDESRALAERTESPSVAQRQRRERYDDYDVLAKPTDQPFQQVVKLNTAELSVINSNSFNARRYGPPAMSNRLLVVLKREKPPVAGDAQ